MSRLLSEHMNNNNLLFYICYVFCRPYIIDLNSTNGTYLNNQRIDPRRYYELKEQVGNLKILSSCLFCSVYLGCD